MFLLRLRIKHKKVLMKFLPLTPESIEPIKRPFQVVEGDVLNCLV